MEVLEKAAEILALNDNYEYDLHDYDGVKIILLAVKDDDWPSQSGFRQCGCDPFSDTLESRRQADAIEDWLYDYEPDLYTASLDMHWYEKGRFGQRIERIKWCLEQLANDS